MPALVFAPNCSQFLTATCSSAVRGVGAPKPTPTRQPRERNREASGYRHRAWKGDTVGFSQASEIYPPDVSPDSRERNLPASLPIPRSDEFQTAILWQVARQHCLLLLRRTFAMLKRKVAHVKQACLAPLWQGKTIMSWPNPYGRF